jgi:Family of unknown function (DUF6328)
MGRLDRNWTDLLRELRVAQTGVQLLTGFLLTVPFKSSRRCGCADAHPTTLKRTVPPIVGARPFKTGLMLSGRRDVSGSPDRAA